MFRPSVALLRDAMLRALNVASQTGVFAILVHAVSESARRFYLSCGFVESPLQSMTLTMALETVRAVLAENGTRASKLLSSVYLVHFGNTERLRR